MFASDLGWKPGYWPETFSHSGKTWKRGHGIANHGEFAGYEYSSGTEKITVFND